MNFTESGIAIPSGTGNASIKGATQAVFNRQQEILRRMTEYTTGKPQMVDGGVNPQGGMFTVWRKGDALLIVTVPKEGQAIVSMTSKQHPQMEHRPVDDSMAAMAIARWV